jgi:hypothetical protein
MNKYPSQYFVTKHPHLYLVWRAMLRRCSPMDREDSHRYYDKGIRVCEEWLWWPNFAQFFLDNGWKRGLTIDRIDNSKGYSPDNCRVATFTEQHHNRDLETTYRRIKEGQTRRWAKPFMCLDTGEVFLTQIEAQRKHGVDRKTLRMALAGKYQQAGGLRWTYTEAS